MTTLQQAQSAVIDNLYLIFGENDVTKRKEAIERLWANSDEAVFVAPEGVFHGHESISKCVDAVLEKFAGWEFHHKGEARVVPPDGDVETRFVKLLWDYGPPEEPQKVQGEDVAVVVNGKIQSLCAFIGP